MYGKIKRLESFLTISEFLNELELTLGELKWHIKAVLNMDTNTILCGRKAASQPSLPNDGMNLGAIVDKMGESGK